MTLSLLATKLFLPPVRAERVTRERLLTRLDALLQPGTRLALISAPAGFGKTSLLAEWIARRGLPAAWLSLDAGDNHPETFLAYLVAALERARPGLARESAAALRAQPPPAAETALAMLVNELASGSREDEPLVIALDDFQVITAPRARECLAFLIEYLPPGLRLALATRSDPALPLARLRARGQMVELRAADLRFDTPETEIFLSQISAGRPGEPTLRQTAAALAERTEGWAAGLQMAGVAMQAAPDVDPAQFVRAFSGSHRFVLDYLAEEVLSRLPETTVAFLLHSAPLERFCAGLCAEVIGDDQPEEAYQELLESLDRANLFLIPLDGERRWFRYHHLFADLLRARLKQQQPGAFAELHRRASRWFERSGHIPEAIRHALAAAAAGQQPAQDFERAASLVEDHTVDLLHRGELHGLQQWMALLPADLVAQRPWLNMQRAWLLTFSGQIAEIEPVLRQVEQTRSALSEAEQRTLAGHCAAVRCYLTAISPDQSAVSLHIRAVEENLAEDSWARGVASWAQGFGLRGQGELARAEAIFAKMFQKRHAQGDVWATAMMCTDLGVTMRIQGRLREALRTYQEGLAFLEENDARAFGYTGRLLTAMAGALYDQNELAAARQLLEEAVALNQRWRNPNHLVFSYNHLARVLIALGEFQPAAALLESADQVLRDLPVLATLTQAVQAVRVNLALAEGRVPPASGALEEQIQDAARRAADGQPEPPFSEPREGQHLLLARVLLAQNRPGLALRLLEAVERPARSGARGTILIELLALKALGHYLLARAGNPAAMPAALAALEEAVARAAPEGSLRPIIDAEPLAPGGLRQLLEALHRRAAGPQDWAARQHIDSLLAALPGDARHAEELPASGKQAARLELVEPLSEREREVLSLLAEGLTNAQIAAKLVISTGTVKAHTANIFRKLDAANRTQAVAIAREGGLV